MTHPLHPMLVHFPIALFLTSLGFDLLSIRWQSDRFQTTSFHTLIAGLAGTLPALLTGGIAEEAVEKTGIPEGILDLHEGLAFATFWIFVAVFGLRLAMRWGFTKDRYRLTTVFAVAGVVVLLITSYYGGSLVYDFGAGVSPRSAR